MRKRKYDDYSDYVDHQKEKTSGVNLRKSLEETFSSKVEFFTINFKGLVKKGYLFNGSRVLCVGARMGEEVQAFINLGHDSKGIDLVPNLPLVEECDFNKLQNKSWEFDMVYSNAFDHAFDVGMFCSSILSVLDEKGFLVLDIFPKIYAKYEAMYIDDIQEVVESMEKNGFRHLRTLSKDINQYTAAGRTLVFKKGSYKRSAFIDCGGHIGESIRRFKNSSEYDESFQMYSFEPLPNSANEYKDMKGISFLQEAVWTEEGESKFYTDEKKRTWGSTLLKEKDTSVLVKDAPIIVKTFDFSKWVGDMFCLDDRVIVKMDIEGAEYPVLRKMIDDGTINLVDEMYIEWHYDRIGMNKVDHDNLVEELSQYVVIKPEMDRVL